MILAWLIAVLLIGGVVAWMLDSRLSRWACLATLGADIALAAVLLRRLATGGENAPGRPGWLEELDVAWIPALGIRLQLAADGLSLLLVALALLLGLAAVLGSWTEITYRPGFFHFNLMWTLAGVVGVFIAMDLFVFYFLWELMLVPMYLLIRIWGHERRIPAAMKFLVFTQAGGLLMLVAILGLVFAHFRATGIWTFGYPALLGTELPPRLAFWLMLGFFAAFAVKLPVLPLHPWLPEAHTQAPTAGSVLLAGLLLKTGGYGLIRFALPLFPDASAAFAPVAMVLGVAGILYGALLAFAQTDLKRLVAYTSVSHLGFVLLGVYAMNPLAWRGAILQMVAHGLSTGGLFIVAGILQERLRTRRLDRMGGLWSAAPRMGALTLVFALASLGLPGLGNFIAELLILLGTFQTSIPVAAVAAAGLVAAAAYSLRLVQAVFHGPARAGPRIPDLGLREGGLLAGMIVTLVWLGLHPEPILALAEQGAGERIMGGPPTSGAEAR